jgi:bacterioferritin
MNDFLSDIGKIREWARRNMDQGPITAGYKADRTKVIGVLNEDLATELVCVLRYKRHYYMAKGIHADSVADAKHDGRHSEN